MLMSTNLMLTATSGAGTGGLLVGELGELGEFGRVCER